MDLNISARTEQNSLSCYTMHQFTDMISKTGTSHKSETDT